ncbi:MAG: hypothetical protein ACKVOA_06895 [Methylophilaceae bacterium]
MSPTANTVEIAVKEAFPAADHSAILAQLNSYGIEPYENEVERVQLTLIRLCQGDPAKLVEQIKIAKMDYRDILVFADRPIPLI